MQTTTKNPVMQTPSSIGATTRPGIETAEQAAALVKNGAAAAALFAAGLGGTVFGILIFLNEHIPAFKAAMTLNKPVGPLSGKSIFGVVGWLVSWVILHALLRNRDVTPRTMVTITTVLVILTLILSFPPVFLFGV